MRIHLIYLFALLSTSSFAQDELENAITRGNWNYTFVNFKGADTLENQVGDTVLLYRVPKRLKFKRNRPVRFKRDGTVNRPQVPFGGCGSVGTLESLWYLKWREYSTWDIVERAGKTFLEFNDLSLHLVDSRSKKYIFIISQIKHSALE